MDTDNTFAIPKINQQPTYNFNVAEKSPEVYEELNQINEEIEKCRLRNL